MPETIHEYTARYRDEDGTSYAVLAVGERRDDGMWEGWIEFQPLLPPGQPVRTGRETTQPNRDALVYWASGLEPVYFEGAFSRARYPGVTTPG
ncbi:MAG TPA: hypothetical protein VJ885_07825 [Thermoanaerobaculia bacterium]|nr:hypothetical protein [Thermoanaerobaculia bacterium]